MRATVKEADARVQSSAGAGLQNREGSLHIALMILAVVAIVYALHAGIEIALPLALALVLKLMFQPTVDFLCVRLRLPQIIGALAVVVSLLALTGGLAFAVSGPASTWLQKMPDVLPAAKTKLEWLRQPIDYFQKGFKEVEEIATPNESAGTTPVAVKQPSTIGSSLALGTATSLAEIRNHPGDVVLSTGLGRSFAACFYRSSSPVRGQAPDGRDCQRNPSADRWLSAHDNDDELVGGCCCGCGDVGKRPRRSGSVGSKCIFVKFYSNYWPACRYMRSASGRHRRIRMAMARTIAGLSIPFDSRFRGGRNYTDAFGKATHAEPSVGRSILVFVVRGLGHSGRAARSSNSCGGKDRLRSD